MASLRRVKSLFNIHNSSLNSFVNRQPQRLRWAHASPRLMQPEGGLQTQIRWIGDRFTINKTSDGLSAIVDKRPYDFGATNFMTRDVMKQHIWAILAL
ncbi:unnamed protein product [Ilex paraguariensis]|uniref:Uncharacterized protein n=1 Tax=Ilex paraguariensis TaxID=185542 RepID=A0ABC8V2S8_9AQUA